MGGNSEEFRSTLANSHGTSKTAAHLAILTILCLLLTWPLLVDGIPDLSSDGFHHACWARLFAIQVWNGELFPRWFSDVNGGLGGPSGFFSPPLANYVSALAWPLVGPHDPEGWLAAGYPIVLAAILGAIAAYFWLRSFTSAEGALLGAVVYMIAPYHLAIDVYVRGASSEFWVFTWFPVVLLAAEYMIRGNRWAVTGAAVGYALAVLSHPTTSLCFAPIPIAYVFFFSPAKQRIRNSTVMTTSLLIGVGLAASYLLPALLDQGKAQTTLYRTNFDFHNHWLIQDMNQLHDMVRMHRGANLNPVRGDELRPFKTRVLEVTLLTLGLIVILFTAVWLRETGNRSRRLARFWTVVALLSFFLMNRPSSFVWNFAGFLGFLQFPFRLNIMLVLSVAVMASLSYAFLKSSAPRLLITSFCLMLIAWLVIGVHYAKRSYYATGGENRNLRVLYEPLERNRIDPPEMWPKPGNNSALSDISSFDLLVASHPPKAVSLEPFRRQSSGTATLVSWRPRRVVLRIDALRSSVLRVNHFYYPGWRAHLEKTKQSIAAYPSPEGLIRVDIPQGTYELSLELPLDDAERAGIFLSLLSCLLICVGAVWAWRGTKPNAHRDAKIATGNPIEAHDPAAPAHQLRQLPAPEFLH